MTEPASAVLGVQGAQASTNAARGLARYVLEHTAALAAAAPGRIARIDLDPEREPPPLPSGVPAAPASVPLSPAPAIYHVMSPFEEIPLGRVWPVWARTPATALVLTLYDLIPLASPDAYLQPFPLLARRYRARLPMLAVADAILCISQATADEARARLGIPPHRLFVINAGSAAQFQPADPSSDGELPARLRAAVPALRPGFVLYVGGVDPRKNLYGLLGGYARLDASLRARHQLVLAQRIAPADRRHLEGVARRLGIAADVVFTGYVDDDRLVDLYRGCALFVLPSLLEGFGLPALEAMRCGAPVVASDIPTMRELVTETAARFDPADPSSITDALRRGLTDGRLRQRMLELARRQAREFTWEHVADATLAAYDAVIAGRARRLSPG